MCIPLSRRILDSKPGLLGNHGRTCIMGVILMYWVSADWAPPHPHLLLFFTKRMTIPVGIWRPRFRLGFCFLSNYCHAFVDKVDKDCNSTMKAATWWSCLLIKDACEIFLFIQTSMHVWNTPSTVLDNLVDYWGKWVMDSCSLGVLTNRETDIEQVTVVRDNVWQTEFLWWSWCLNSGLPHTYKTGTLPLEPCLQSISLKPLSSWSQPPK
jgi:hypothetical protein